MHRNNSNYFKTHDRYFYQGQEMDNEVKGEGNSYTTEFRQLDSRLARWLSLDPIVKEHESPYASFANNPIWFMDPNGADTANFESTIKTAGFKTANRVVSESQTYRDFITKFTSGDGPYHDIKLEFKAVKDLKSADAGASVLGQCRLMYKGTWVEDINSLPSNAKISDFTILVELNSSIQSPSDGMSGAGDALKAIKAVTLVHELLVHASTAADIINNNRIKGENNNSGINGTKVKEEYKEKLPNDHLKLYSDKSVLFNLTYQELVNIWKLKTVPTKKVANPSIDYPSRKNWTIKKKQDNPTLQFYEILWQEFDNDNHPFILNKY